MDDSDVVDRARRGSAEALNLLFDRCWPLMWRTAYAVLDDPAAAEDAAQEAMLKLLRSLGRFDASRPLAPWIRRIAANTAIDARRVRRANGEFATDPVDLAACESTDAEDSSSGRIASAVRALPEGKRIAVVLHYWLGFSTAEIADLLGIPHGTVMSRLHRAVDDLRLRTEGSRREDL